MSVTVKVIKPKPFDDKAARDYGRSHVAGAGQKMLVLFKDTTATWKHKPEFKLETKTPSGEWTTSVTTDDEIYRYVDEGTGKAAGHGDLYPIRPKKPGGRLAFPSIFSPKSAPRSLKAEAGAHGPVDTFRQVVMHPGIKPREFTKEILKLVGATFKKDMQATVAGMAKVSGHSIK